MDQYRGPNDQTAPVGGSRLVRKPFEPKENLTNSWRSFLVELEGAGMFLMVKKPGNMFFFLSLFSCSFFLVLLYSRIFLFPRTIRGKTVCR